MVSKNVFLNISKKLLLLLFLTIPFNLGKHFEISSSFIDGVLVDYLVPTIFFQDVVVLLVIFFWLIGSSFEGIVGRLSHLFKRKEVQMSLLFVFALFLATLSSVRFVPSICAWLRMFLYFILFLYILSEIPVEEYFFKILDIISGTVLLLSILGILQFLTDGSVFDNYLIFGEQPYSYSSPDIVRESFLGKSVVPSYGLFRHPNTFGGFLSIFLLWLFSFLQRKKSYLISFLFGTIALVFTLSYLSWLVFILGLVSHLFIQKRPKSILKKKYTLILITTLVCFLATLLPTMLSANKFESPSIHRRIGLAKSSISVFKENPLFGIGFNNISAVKDKYNFESSDVRFTQPVHNIFLLLLSEGGIASLSLFILFLFFVGKKLLNSSYFHLFLISFLQIILLGSFDHYLVTSHQTLLLFWLVIAFAIQ